MVLDHQMPGMTGLDLAAVLRSDPATRGLPILLATSAGQSALLLATLSLLERDTASSSQQPHSPGEVTAAAHSLRILVTEDNAINQQVAVGLLSKLGHRADVAADGAEAVDRVVAGDYDLVLMDMQMPTVDGLATTRMIRALPGPKSQVTIIAMTANAMAADRDACLAGGMNDFIAKPNHHPNARLRPVRHCPRRRPPLPA